MIALSDGTIINSEDSPAPALDYTGGSLNINDSEEAKNAKFNIEQARNADIATDSTGNDILKETRLEIV